MAQTKITVFIYLPGQTVAVPAGIFTHDRDLEIGTFGYGRRYQIREDALPADPVALPLGLSPREVTINKGLYGSFRDAAPDYWGRLVIAAQQRVPPEALSEIDFLLNANATRVGNLDFRSSPDDPEPNLKPPHFNQMDTILTAASKIEAGERASESLIRLLRQGTSVGGARPKCTVQLKDDLWIAKFPSKEDTFNICRIEYATMTLAGKCGINIPEMKLLSVGKKDIFLVQRFDREKTKNGWLRKGFISALSLMQWDETDRLSWDYASIADLMRRHAPVENIQELFRRMVFNILVRNTDDHPRNHGFIFDDTGMRLSPAYDIVPSFALPGVGTSFSLAMSVGDFGREATIQNALSRADRFGFVPDEAQKVVQDMIESVKEWKAHYASVGCPDTEIEALSNSFVQCCCQV